MMRSSKVKRWEKGRRWLASSILLAALSIVAARSNAAILVTGTIETTNGSNSNASGASWNSWGALTYWASTEDTFLFVTHYGWEDAKHFFYGLSGYVDADVYHRRFIYYNPGSPSLIWESCSLNNMDVTTIPTNGSWTALADDDPNPGGYAGSMSIDVVYKVQSGGLSGALEGQGTALSHTAS